MSQPALTYRISMVLVAVLSLGAPAQAEQSIASEESTIVVFCAAGATDVVNRLVREYEAVYDVEVKLNFASSSTLARQIEAGAKADVFVSASTQWMDYVQEKGLLIESSRRDLAANRLALVVPRDNATHLTWQAGQNLPETITGKIAIGDPAHVPVGIYTKQALESIGCYEALKDQFVACPSVRAALRLVGTGHVEAGIVYKSDVVASQRVDVVSLLPTQWHESITFQIARLANCYPIAESLEVFFLRDESQVILSQFGFDTLDAVETGMSLDSTADTSWWQLSNVERSALLISLKVALGSVLLLLVPGILLGFVLARKDFVGKSLVEGLVHAPLVLPPIVTGYLLLLVLGNNGIIGRWLHDTWGLELAFTYKAAILASSIVALPLMVRSVRIAIAATDRGLEQASYVLGANRLKTFLLVSLPLAAPGVTAGLVLAFARSLGEFGATAVFMGNIEGQRTLPLAIYSSLQMAHQESFAWRLVAVSVVVSILALAASEILAKRARRYAEENHAS